MKKIQQSAEKIFHKEILEELCQWYKNIIYGKWDYVVFVVRRSYILALLLEKITGKKMEENSAALFLTDASLILQCRKMADIYKETGSFPSILLCDEQLLHGRSFNHLIQEMENRLTEYLPDRDPQDIRRALADAVQIYVYARTDQEVLLYGQYEEKMKYMRRENARFLHSFSSNISEWILCSGLSNTSYVYSRAIGEAQMADIRKKQELICTKYQNTYQYTSVAFIGTGNRKKAVLSLRFVKVKETEGYLAIPFVFLPNLHMDVTVMLWDEVKNRVGNTDFQQMMQLFSDIPGKRIFNEFLTMLFSNVVLYDFLERFQIRIQPEEEESESISEEIQKLARNYNFDTLHRTCDLLRDLLLRKLFDRDEMTEMFERVIPDSYKVLELSTNEHPADYALLQDSIIRRLESYFYSRGWQEEKSACRITQAPYYMSPRRSERQVRGCCFILTELCSGYESRGAELLIAYFMQMMDAGILSLSSYAPNNMDVVGYAQFVKAGELSLLLEPLRFYEYLPMLASVQAECRKWKIDFRGELERFSSRMELGFDSDRINGFWEFIRALGMIMQKADEWVDEGYLRKIQFDSEEEKQSFLLRQLSLKESYHKYLLYML